MNFIQRAFRYVIRKPTKSLLLVLTFFLIGNLVILGLGVSQAADNAKILTRKKMRAIVTYEVDSNAYWNYIESIDDEDQRREADRNRPHVSLDKALSLAADPQVVAFNYMETNVLYADGVEGVPLGNEKNDGTDDYVRPNIMAYGFRFPNIIELKEGTYTIVEGNWMTKDQIDDSAAVAVITKDFADLNNLRVGDTLTVGMTSPSEFKHNAETYRNAGYTLQDTQTELEIIGIYTTKESLDPNADNFKYMSLYDSPKNRILMPLTTMADILTENNAMNMKIYPDYYTEADVEAVRTAALNPNKVIYLLDDPLHVDGFVSQHSGTLDEYQILNANNETFRKMARPLDTMSFFAGIVVWIVVINAIVIISLVTALTMKTREFEIGVLLSIGVSKLMVVMQLFLELIVVAFIGFACASVSGSIMAGNVGEMVLDFQTTADAQYESADDTDSYYWNDTGNYFTNLSQSDMLAEYHVSVSPLLIAEIFLLGTGVVLIAIVIPSFMIMRLNPKQILLEQN